MKTLNLLLNWVGREKSYKQARRSRGSLESIVSRFSLASLICLCMLTIGSGNVWGITTSDLETSATTTLEDGATYVIANAYNGTYLMGELDGSWGKATTTIGDAAIFTAHGSNSGCYLTCSAGRLVPVNSNSFSAYDTGTSNNLNIGGSGQIQMSSNTSRILRLNGKFRWYTSSTGSIVYLFKIKSATPTVTPDPTSLSWGTVLQGSSQSTKTISISGSNLTAGSLTISATGGYSVTPTSKGVSGTLSTTTLTVTPPSTATVGTKNGKVTISGGGLASNVEINLTMTVQASHTVTWMVNGTEHATTQVADGSKPEFPSDPSSCDGTSTTFVGWTPTPWSGKLDDVSAKTIYTSGSAMPNVSGPVTYHAVFAKGTANTYKKGTKADLTDGQTVLIVNPSASVALKGDKSAQSVTITSNKITTASTAVLWTVEPHGSGYYFKYGNNYLNAGTSSIYVDGDTDEWSVSGSGPYVLTSGNNTSKSLQYYNSTWKMYDTGNNSYFQMDFYIPDYSQYLTTCCNALGTINGSITLSNADCTPNQLKATWKMSATTGIASQVLHIYKASDDSEVTASKITGLTASTSNQTQTISGLDPCTTYYVKVENISSGSSFCGDGFAGEKSSNVTTNAWGVTEHLTHTTHTTGAATACPGSNYVATYTVESGYVLPSNITLTIGGVSKTKDTHYTWSVSDDVGTLTILAANITNSAGAIDITVTSTAAAYQFWYGPSNSGDGWTATSFTDIGNNEWQITNFVIPAYEWDGAKQLMWNVSGSGISATNREFYALAFAQTQHNGCGDYNYYNDGSNKDAWIRGAGPGAKGTLRIYDNKADNGWCAFIPNEYVLKFGTSELLFTETSTNVWETAITSLSTLNGGSWTGSTTYRVGVGNASHAYVEVYNKCAATAASAMGYKTNAGDNWATGLNNISTARGKFRIWINNCTNGNWECHFVPYHRVVFHSNYPGGGGPADTYAGETSVEESNGSIALADAPSAPTGYHFIGWYDAAEGGNLITTARSISAGASANIDLYAHWSNQTTITLSKNGGSENGSAVGTYGSNVVGSFVPVTRNSTTYRLLGYSKSGTPSEIVIDASGNFVANTTYTDASGNWKSTLAEVTLVAQWQAGHTITWMANGETYTTTFVDAGGTLVLPAVDPTSCDDGDTDTYLTFIGWYSTAAGTNSSPTASIASCGTKATTSIVPDANTTYYAVWGNGTVEGTTTYEITTTLTKGKTYVFGAVKAEPSTTLANNTAIGAVAFATTYSSCSWGEYENVTPSSTGVISSSDVTAACIWTLENISSGNYSFKKSSDYVYLKDGTGKQTAGIYTSAQVYLTDETATCKDAFKLHPGSTSTNKLMLNTGSTYGYRVYGSGQAESGSMCPYIRFYEQKVSAAATGFISSCCASSAVVTVEPDEDELDLDIDGEATTDIDISQTGGGAGRYYPPTVSPAGASVDFTTSYKTAAYTTTFTATAAGTYTVKGNFTETSYGCAKTGSATITVAANPILTPSSNSVAIDATCGLASSATDITVNSRYLASTSITASVVTSTGTGSFKISSDNSSFDTSNKTITGGTSSKATSHIYVRYDATDGQTGSATGTLTLTCGEKVVNIPLSATVTCSAHVVLSSESPIQITAANSIWVEAASVVNVEGSYLTTNADNANVSIRAYTNNAHFQIKTGGTTGEGAAKTSQGSALALVTNHSTATWSGSIGIVYKPAAHNTTETATLTVEVYKAGGSKIYDTKTYTLYGRSLPENFVIAVNDGTLADGHWYAVPADMIAPWGSGCSALGTYAPYAITVDNPTGVPTIASNVPSRAVYTAVERTGATNTNPQTMSYKSVPLSVGGTNYYLYGSSTDVDSDGSNTSIQNATNESSEKQKWFIDVVDWDNKKYNMHIASNLNTYKLAYNATSNIRRVGLYSDAAINKKDIYILPISGTTCTYYTAPDVTCYATDATNYTVRFARDRISTYEVKVGSGSWTTLTTREITDCTGEEAKKLEADLPWSTYRGQTVQIRAKVASGGCQEIGSFVVPDPSITVKSGTWTSLTGVAGYAFSDATNGITISGLASCDDGASVEVSGTDADKITAELNSTTGVVTIGMTAANAVAGTYNATLTFTAPGATTRTQNITITIYSYAPISISSPQVSNGYYCKNSAASAGYIYIDGGSNKLCGYNLATDNYLVCTGSPLSYGDYFHNYIIDLTDGDSTLITKNNAETTDYKIAFNLPNNANLQVGHTYRFYFNYDRTGHLKTVYNESGVPFMPTVFEFTVVDCSKPTALPACPITNSGFTANWFNPSCSGTTTVNVYQKAEAEILNTNFIDYGLYKAWSYAYNDNYYGVWVYGGTGTVHGDAVSSSHASGQYIARSSKTCEWFSPMMSTLSSSINTNTELVVEVTVYHSNNNNNNQTLKVIVIDNPQYSNDAVPTTGETVYFNGVSGDVWTSESISASGETKTFKIAIKGAKSNSRIGFYGASKINTTYLKSVKISTASKSNQTSVTQSSCSVPSKAVTGLNAGAEYYYTVTNNGQTSDEQRVVIRPAAPSITYFPAKVDMQTDVNGTVEQLVTFTGKNLTPCDVETILAANNKAGSTFFSVAMGSNIRYDAATGALSGSFTVTYHPTSTGEHDGTFKVGNVGTALPLVGHACPSGFGNMANNGASPKTANSATVSWSLQTTGTVMLAQGTRLNTELLSNGGFELELAGWDEDLNLPGDICTAVKRSGSNSRYCTYKSAADLAVNGRTGFNGVYTEEMTFLPGTYYLEGYVRHATNSTTAGAFDLSYNEFYIGICKDTTSSLSSYLKFTSVVAPEDYTFQFNSAADGWKKIYLNFTLTEKIVGRVFVGRKNSAANCAYFFLDDVSLQCTAAGALDDKSMYSDAASITNAYNVNLTGLRPQTTYSFYVVDEDGCESNIATFTTNTSSVPISITADPETLSIAGPLEKTVSRTFNVTTVNAYAQLIVSSGTCTDGRIKVSPSSLSPDGGLVTVSFTPKSTDNMGDSGSCTLQISTTGASDPEEVTVNWSITSGFDPSTPVVEVVDISNYNMSIEHNVTPDQSNTTVSIIINREKNKDEIEENVGDELFFSKYYEADKNVKLLAVFNPTKDTISLAGTSIWLSRDAENYWGDNDMNKMSLAPYGHIKKGYICPSEELIFYRYEQNVGDDAATIACAAQKVDMSDWYRVYNNVLSFSGNDAFVLVRDTTVNKRIPPAVSQADGNPALSWEYIGAYVTKDSASADHKYAMLDIVGARTEENKPSNANLAGTWHWTNCKASNAAESGDASGWYGYGQDLKEQGQAYYKCGSNSKYWGYLLSTNRCLLIRLKDVKSGSNAVQQNLNDFKTLDWHNTLEWQGTHVPTDPDDDVEVAIACENFSFIGGYDYAGYYNKWTPLDDDEYIQGALQPDGSWNITLTKGTPHYYCHWLRIQVAEQTIVNGVEVENVHATQEYKVPIVVDGADEKTTDTRFRGSADASNASDPEGQNILTAQMCDSCDVVIRGGAKLTHQSNTGQSKFRNMQVYAGGKLDVKTGLNMDLEGLQVRSTNDAVGYAIINNADASITIDTVLHVKRIDDMYWYPFSLPYDCKVSQIRQLNGKIMGEYGDMLGNGDWMIQKYDGYNRQITGTSAFAGENGQHWVRVEPNETLKANQAYIIGLYTAEEVEDPDSHTTYHKMKFVYFPPITPTAYTENGSDTKTANVTAWKGGSDAPEDKRHHGWNFVGLPYLSVFDPAGFAEASAGVNNSAVMIMGKINDKDGTYTDTENVYVSIPDGGSTRTYTQVTAKNQKLEPFKGYFIQVKDGTVAGATGETKTIAYSKTGRTLNKAPRLVSTTGNARARIEMAVTELTEQPTAEPLTDNAGLLVSDDYTTDYEIGLDLTKMYAAAAKPQLFSLTADNQKLAYNALPVDNAQYIPLGFYAPKKGTYILSVKEKQSELENVTAVWLLYNGQEVKNLMFGDFQINATKKGLIEGYAVRVDMAHKVPTIISTETDGTDNITISQQDGKLFVDGVAEGATITLYDMVGKQMSSAKASSGYAEMSVPVAGSYNIVVRTDKSVKTIKTVVR